jgi:hypothetical protein
MPFVIQYPNGKYLFRYRGGSLGTRRRLVTSLDEASTWTCSNHAKNAAIAAIESRNSEVHLAEGEHVVIWPVALHKRRTPITYSPKGK